MDYYLEETKNINNKPNFARVLELELADVIKFTEENHRPPRLLLHSCCAPCSSAVLEYISEYFEITDMYYNPNISPESEFRFRESELKRLIDEMSFKNKVEFLQAPYDPESFYAMAKGHENDKEGGKRCFMCYEMRMRKAGEYAKEHGYDYFTTTLSISPMKSSAKLNEIGHKLSMELEIPYLYSDFKKKNGYKRSIELSKEHDLYRQNYCGCVFSKRDSGSIE